MHASLRRHAKTSAHGEWYAPECRILTLLPSTKHGQKAVAKHKSHPPPPTQVGPRHGLHKGVSNPSWLVAERSRPSWTLPFLSVGGEGRTSTRRSASAVALVRRSRRETASQGVTRARRARQRAGRRVTFRWRRRSLGRRDRRDRLAARDDGGGGLGERAGDAIREPVRVRVAGGERGGTTRRPRNLTSSTLTTQTLFYEFIRD